MPRTLNISLEAHTDAILKGKHAKRSALTLSSTSLVAWFSLSALAVLACRRCSSMRSFSTSSWVNLLTRSTCKQGKCFTVPLW